MFRKSDTLVAKILGIIKNKEMSSWDISKILKVDEELIRYHLKKLCDKGVVMKLGSKYYLVNKVITSDGTIVVSTPKHFFVLYCPYADKCKCNTSVEECRYLKELPKNLKKEIGID